MDKNDMHFSIHRDCFLVNGYAQSLICDTSKSRARGIPNSLYTLLSKAEKDGLSYERLLSISSFPDVTGMFCEQLVDEGYAFFSPIFIKRFQEFDFEHLPWYLIIEVDRPSNQFLTDAISLCKELNPLFLQLRFPTFDGFNHIKEILKLFNQVTLERIEILIPYSNSSHRPVIISDLFNQIEELEMVWFYNCKTDVELHSWGKENVNYLVNHYSSIDSDSISMHTMVCNFHSVNISNKRNMGQFHKLRLNKRGYLTNIGYGKSQLLLTSTTTIQDLLDSEITNSWSITKDQIEVCKVCQYKRICHDTSEIVQRNNKYYRYEKCSYDPYKNVWSA